MSYTELIETFKEKASGAGYLVYVAETKVRALDHIMGMVRENDIKLAVISESPTADYLGLYSMLTRLGIRTMQTSIVKWVLQLARGKEVPFDKVAELILSITGERVEHEPQELLKAARRALKQIYAGADLGVTQADYGIAESGTPVNLESSDNARLASVLPRLHLTLLDSSQIVPGLPDLADRIKGSSIGIPGHKAPTFITYLTDRNRAADTPRSQGRTGEHILVLNLQQ
jgi:L-lactate utilization protein LutB